MNCISRDVDSICSPEPDFKVLLARLGLRQCEFAKLLGVSSRAVNMWAAGDIELPGPVAGYLRLLDQMSPEQRKGEFDRLPGREKSLEEGVYRFEYVLEAFGDMDSGQALCVLRNGKLFGCDPWGGVLRGGYRFNPVSGKTVLDVALRMPEGSMIALDLAVGTDGGAVNIVGAFARAAPSSKAVLKVGGVPVEVTLLFLGPLPN